MKKLLLILAIFFISLSINSQNISYESRIYRFHRCEYISYYSYNDFIFNYWYYYQIRLWYVYNWLTPPCWIYDMWYQPCIVIHYPIYYTTWYYPIEVQPRYRHQARQVTNSQNTNVRTFKSPKRTYIKPNRNSLIKSKPSNRTQMVSKPHRSSRYTPVYTRPQPKKYIRSTRPKSNVRKH